METKFNASLPQCAICRPTQSPVSTSPELSQRPHHYIPHTTLCTVHCVFLHGQTEPTHFIGFLWFVILQRLKLDRKWLPVKTAYIQTVIFEMFEYVVCKTFRDNICKTLCKLSSVLDTVQI